MGWTPPTKFTVFLSFLLMVFGIFILIDQSGMFYLPPLLPVFLIGTYSGWFIIALILFFLTWFIFFLGVKLKGL